MQEALARAWERSERGEHIESLRAWVTTVALNLTRSGLRRLGAERRAKARLRELHSEPGIAMASERLDLARALAELSRTQREATILHYYMGMDVWEVAEALGAPEGTVKSNLHRARAALARALGTDDAEEVGERGKAR